MPDPAIQRKFQQALKTLVEQLERDRSVLAAILCGSLAHDTVWAKSDIDLVLITIDDRKVAPSEMSIYADGVNVHACLIPRTDFRKTVEGSLHNSFMHSLLAKGQLLYAHDPTIEDLCGRLAQIGERDTGIQLLNAATQVLPAMYKARKWLVTRGDLEYTALWILYAATPLAQVEVIGARQLADREVIPQAMKLNPALFKIVYSDLLNAKKTSKNVEMALETLEAEMAKRTPVLFRPIMDHLREVREARSSIELENYFKLNLGVEGVTLACEYLSDQGLVGKVSIPVQLTRKSNVEVQQLAFVYLESES